ncbi:DUF5677 domain-containing protein [Streptomyces sp. NBC_01477]|uniref:DUF5677 domain-containing protein n=1 Tax=Streptomyces sp. NBC_01477 TaxID=2976015 RepID=UPI002E336A99|nr:DUF5677 domain-containing protein [Streptomyces sp. NBC_01477]
MTYTAFKANERTAKRVRAIVPQLIAAADDALNTGALADVAYRPAFPLLAGWWQFTNRTADAMLTLYDAGHGAVAAPLMRNLIGHAYAMHWLVDNGQPAVDAVEWASWNGRRKLLDNLIEVDWKLPDEGVDIGKEPAFEHTEAEAKRHKRLIGEIDKFVNLVRAYGDSILYPVYRNLSGYTHTTELTAATFVEQDDDGRITVHREERTDRLVDICWMVVPLLQAASVMSPVLTTGKPLKQLVIKACGDLGLPEDLLPRRRK